ncbi:MAG: MgtC/SapB family protein [Bradyrhizobiaceae bacterium]|nr:MAG: MgtC/SapB family protein [Bradyrhizobiaceae bacterium]
MLDWSEIVLRLGVATLASGAIGLNRDLHGKPIGLRTLGLVGLATALVVALANPQPIQPGHFSDGTSRVIQGVLTGIGFLGAGVIVHISTHGKVHGLTSAACVWFTACIGVVCGAGEWRLVAVALGIAFLLLAFGGPAERLFHRVLRMIQREPPPNDEPNTLPE